jgi:hypothetical protein
VEKLLPLGALRPDSNLPAYCLEYDLSEHQFTATDLQALGDLVVGGPLYIRLKDRQIVATVKMVAIRPSSILLYIKFLDAYLEKNIDNPDALGLHYQLLDCVDPMLREPT